MPALAHAHAHAFEQLVMASPPLTVEVCSSGHPPVVGLLARFTALFVAVRRRGVLLEIALPHALAPAVLASLACLRRGEDDEHADEETGDRLVADHGHPFV